MIYWFAFIATEIIRHYILIEKRKIKPNYMGSFCWRFFWGFVCLSMAHPHTDPILEIVELIPFILFQMTSFWILFDIGLNLSRGKSLFYNGKDSGWLDDIDEVFSEGVYWILKGIALIVMVYTMIELI